MRLLLTAANCPKGEVERNLSQHVDLHALGTERGCDLVLLPEMSLTGYSADAAIALAHPGVRQLVEATTRGSALCFGLAEADNAGGAPCITQVVAVGGRVAAVHRKAALGEDEHGVFRVGAAHVAVPLGGLMCAFAICAAIHTQPPYQKNAALVLGPAAPGLYGERRTDDAAWQRGFDWWRSTVLADAARLLAPNSWLAVSTQAGATVDEDFPGWAALIGGGGNVVAELLDWREGTLVVDVPATA